MTVIVSTLASLTPYFDPGLSLDSGLLAMYPPEIGCAGTISAAQVADPRAKLTDTALAYIARSGAEGLAYKITTFQVGASGFNPAAFTQPTPLLGVTGVSMLRYEGPVVAEPASIDQTLWSYTCTVPRELVSALGEIALIAEIVASPVNPTEIGTKFVYAIAHVAGVPKNVKSSVRFRFLLRG